MNKRTVGFLIVTVAIGALVAGGVVSLLKNLERRRAELEAVATSMKRQDVSVTVVEGKRREEIAALMEKAGICSAADFMTASTDKEGTLFPDTYRFFPTTPAREVVATFQENFRRKSGSPTQDQLILASIVEREAKDDSERSLIAGIYMNRLKIGMKLEADPTVQYAKESLAFSSSGNPVGYAFWQPITQDDYQQVLSPFNTYRTTGLPPAPIADPGTASIRAAITPKVSDYLYFVHRNGVLYPSKTLTEHLGNVAK